MTESDLFVLVERTMVNLRRSDVSPKEVLTEVKMRSKMAVYYARVVIDLAHGRSSFIHDTELIALAEVYLRQLETRLSAMVG